jgi:hypothetical protein
MIEMWANISQTRYNSSKDLVHFFSLSLHLHMMNNPCTRDISVLIKRLPKVIECFYKKTFLGRKGCSLLGPLLVPPGPLVNGLIVREISTYIISLVVILSIYPSRHPFHHPSIQVPHLGRKRWWKRRTRKNGGSSNLSKCLLDFSLVKIGCY